MIDFQNISFSYGEESRGGGIRNINLTIKTGEFVLLTGESGCGKTTITRLVNGLVLELSMEKSGTVAKVKREQVAIKNFL